MIPQQLSDWSFEIIKELIDKKIVESDMHDFKADIPSSETLTKACCAFANSKGGFIILGVKERSSNFEICGIENDKELAHKFGQNIKANPTIYFSLPKIINIPDSLNVIAIFEIPLSPERPHVPDHSPEKRIFQKRTNKGNDYMTYEEIKMSFQNYQERREKLKLLYIELFSNYMLLDSIYKNSADAEAGKFSIITIDNIVLTSLLTELYSSISNDKELVKILLVIRGEISIINNKIKLLFSIVALPKDNDTELLKEHNKFINPKIEKLRKLITRAIEILETRFQLANPLE